MMRAARAFVVLAVLAFGAGRLLPACASEEPPEDPTAATPVALDPDARGWLTRISSAHVEADDALAGQQPDKAHAALRGALERAVPAQIGAEHVRWVQQDLWYRLAAIDLEREPTRALLEADRGLALGQHDDLFSANLLAARGRALQALGRDTEAASSYHAALKIDERLLRAALGSSDDGGP